MKNIKQPLSPRIKDLWRMAGLGESRASHFYGVSGMYYSTDKVQSWHQQQQLEHTEHSLISLPQIAKKHVGKYGAPCPGGRMSVFFVDNVNYFGKIGGFDLALQRIEARDPRLPLQELVHIHLMISIMRNMFTVKWGKTFFTKYETSTNPTLHTHSHSHSHSTHSGTWRHSTSAS